MVEKSRLPFGNDIIHNLSRNNVSSDSLEQVLSDASTDGVSICVRIDQGANERGGYLFHYTENNEAIQLEYFPFNPEDKTYFSNWEDFSRFVNHAIGKKWDKEMYERSLQIVTRIE